jgi:hypothetical protein
MLVVSNQSYTSRRWNHAYVFEFVSFLFFTNLYVQMFLRTTLIQALVQSRIAPMQYCARLNADELRRGICKRSRTRVGSFLPSLCSGESEAHD